MKDAFDRYVVNGETDAVNPAGVGTKAAMHYVLDLPPGGQAVVRLRLFPQDAASAQPFGAEFDAIFQARIDEADEFYSSKLSPLLSADLRRIGRQGFAGLLWSKQFYHYVVREWLEGDPEQPTPPDSRWKGRNRDWLHSVQPRCRLHAGQLGIPLVCRVGFGVSHDHVRHDRSGIRQGTAHSDASGMVHAPQRPIAGV